MMPHLESTNEIVEFFSNSVRVGGVNLEVEPPEEAKRTVIFSSPFTGINVPEDEITITLTPSANIKIWVGRITSSEFDISGSVAAANIPFTEVTIYYHAWK